MQVKGESVRGSGGGEGYLTLLKRHRASCLEARPQQRPPPQPPHRGLERDTSPLPDPRLDSEWEVVGRGGQGSVLSISGAPDGGGLLAVVLFLEARKPRV